MVNRNRFSYSTLQITSFGDPIAAAIARKTGYRFTLNAIAKSTAWV